MQSGPGALRLLNHFSLADWRVKFSKWSIFIHNIQEIVVYAAMHLFVDCRLLATDYTLVANNGRKSS